MMKMCVAMQRDRKSTFNRTGCLGEKGHPCETRPSVRGAAFILQVCLSVSEPFHMFTGHSKYML